MALYYESFNRVFSHLLESTGVTGYTIAQYTGIDQGYISCLKNGNKNNPSPEVIVKISIALAHFSTDLKISDIEELFDSIGRSLHSKY